MSLIDPLERAYRSYCRAQGKLETVDIRKEFEKGRKTCRKVRMPTDQEALALIREIRSILGSSQES